MDAPTTQWTTKPIDDADMAFLLRLLFSEPAPEAGRTDLSSCGFDAACETFDRHLRWFDEDARAQRSVA